MSGRSRANPWFRGARLFATHDYGTDVIGSDVDPSNALMLLREQAAKRDAVRRGLGTDLSSPLMLIQQRAIEAELSESFARDLTAAIVRDAREGDGQGRIRAGKVREAYGLPSSYIDEHPELRADVYGSSGRARSITEADLIGWTPYEPVGPRFDDAQSRAYLAGMVSCTSIQTYAPSAYAVISEMSPLPRRRFAWGARILLRVLRAWDRFWTWAMGLTGYDRDGENR